MELLDMCLGPLFLLMTVVFQRNLFKFAFTRRFNKATKPEWFWFFVSLFFGIILTIKLVVVNLI